MSGIAGVYRDDDPSLVEGALRRMEHRGPGKKKIYRMVKGTLGYTTIEKDHIPPTDDLVAISDGRIILDGKEEEEEIGTDGDLLQMYREYEKNCVRYLNGPFALAVMAEDELFLARDPLGLKPLR